MPRLRQRIIAIQTDCWVWFKRIRYEKQKAKYVYTWEVFGDLKAHNDDCFRMFNPVRDSYPTICSGVCRHFHVGVHAVTGDVMLLLRSRSVTMKTMSTGGQQRPSPLLLR